MATEVGQAGATHAAEQVQSGTAAGASTQAQDFLQGLYSHINANRHQHNESYLALITELNDVNNKAAMLSAFMEAVQGYEGSGEADDFEQQVLAPFRQENPGFDEAFDISQFRTEDGYDVQAIADSLQQSQESLNNISSQKQLEINHEGMVRDQYTAFIARVIQDVHRLLDRLLNG